MLTDAQIEEIRAAADLVDVAADYVQLKRSGTKFLARCPFHNEKSPSFNVDPQQNLYYCFGCSRGGDVFTFVQEIETVGFLESARMLAERFGIELPEEGGENDERRSEREEVFHALRFAARFFYHQMTQTETGKARGLAYFQNRGFTPKTIKTFGLGYAPERWDGLLKHAAEHHISAETLEKAGLVVKKDRGGHYDRYRGRAIFPIFSHVGKVLGFGGRILEKADNQPKYINSPETMVYHKSDVLYGLHQAKQAIRREEEALLVEGYTDVVSLHQAGVQNAVASSGTALTAQQVKLIDRYAKRVLLVYDADTAGANATLRGIDMVLEHGLAAYVLALPDGADPDSYVQQYGADSFRAYAKKERQDFIHFKLEQASRTGDLSTPEGRADTTRGILASIARIPDMIRRETYLREASAILKIPEATLHQSLDVLTRSQKQEQRREERREQIREAVPPPSDAPPSMDEVPPPWHDTGVRPETEPPVPQRADILPTEKTLIRLMLEHGGPLVELVLGNMALDEFTAGPAREAASHLLQQYQTGKVHRAPFLDGTYGDALKRLVAEVCMDRHEVSGNWKEKIGVEVPRLNEAPRESALSAMTLLKLRRVNEAIKEVQRELFQAQQEDIDVTGINQRLMAMQELRGKVQRREYLDWNTV